MKTKRGALLVGIAILLSLALVSATLAQGQETLTTQSLFNINIRATPGLNGGVIGILPPGQEATVIGRTSGNNWVQIQYQTTTGWIAAWLLTFSDDTIALPVTTDLQPAPINTGQSIEMLAPFNINVRATPSINGALLRTLPFNSRVPAVARSAESSWVRIQGPNVDGWVAAWLVILDGDINALPIGSGTASPPVPPVSPDDDDATATPEPDIVDNLPPVPEGALSIRAPFRVNVRSSPALDSAVLDVLPFGATVAAVGRNAGNNWIQIEYNNTLGWVAAWVTTASSQTSFLPITDASEAVAVTGDAINASGPFEVIIRNGPGVAFGQVGALPAATLAVATARTADSDWIRLSYGGVEGWSAAWALLGTADFNNLPVAGGG